jgi:hypothetical protein
VTKFPPALVMCFAAFSVFSYFQQRHFRNFRGASPIFEFVLGVSATLSMVVSLCFLIYYGIRVGWWTPFVLVGLDLLIFPLGVVVARFVTPFGMSLLGFIAWPVLAYLMFVLVPHAP